MQPLETDSDKPRFTLARQQTFVRLLEAYETAIEVGNDPSAFACQLPSLFGSGVSDTVLRWLVAQGYARHCIETTRKDDPFRTFQFANNQRFTESSCFFLTSAGVELARRITPWNGMRLDTAHPLSPSHLPHYDADRRMLTVEGLIVKQFRAPAENQELILKAFQEENWPPILTDPLPGKKAMDAKRRLNNAIRHLNSRQHNRLLRFQGDGTGTGILWQRLRKDNAERT